MGRVRAAPPLPSPKGGPVPPHLGRLALVLSLAFVLGQPARSQPPAAEGKADAKEGSLPRTDLFGDPLPPGALARLGAMRFRHDGNLRSLVFSRDGKVLAGATHSRAILWDAVSGKERPPLPLATSL